MQYGEISINDELESFPTGVVRKNVTLVWTGEQEGAQMMVNAVESHILGQRVMSGITCGAQLKVAIGVVSLDEVVLISR